MQGQGEMMDAKRIEELAALPLPGVIASEPDEYERRRTAYAIRIAVNEVLSAMTDKCRWVQDGDGGPWATGCGSWFSLNDGTPSENGMIFCYHCGKTLDEAPYSEEDE